MPSPSLKSRDRSRLLQMRFGRCWESSVLHGVCVFAFAGVGCQSSALACDQKKIGCTYSWRSDNVSREGLTCWWSLQRHLRIIQLQKVCVRSAISAVAENRRCLPLPVLIIATKRTILPPLWEEALASTDKVMLWVGRGYLCALDCGQKPCGWRKDSSPPLLPFLLLLCTLADEGLAQVLGYQQANWWGTSLRAAGARRGQDAGGQLALIPPREHDMCGAAGTGGAVIPGLGDVCDTVPLLTSGDLSC